MTISPSTVQHGDAGVDTAITKALGGACESGQVTCNDAGSSLVQSTKIYNGPRQDPLSGQLTFAHQGIFHEGMGNNYVTALANVAKAVQQCKQQTLVDEGETRSGEDGTHTETFCSGPADIAIVRFNSTTNGQIDSLYYSVVLKEQSSTASTWCNIAGVLSAVAGAFDGALSSIFGVAALGYTGLTSKE